jgi:hypothetical protein
MPGGGSTKIGRRCSANKIFWQSPVGAKKAALKNAAWVVPRII